MHFQISILLPLKCIHRVSGTPQPLTRSTGIAQHLWDIQMKHRAGQQNQAHRSARQTTTLPVH